MSDRDINPPRRGYQKQFDEGIAFDQEGPVRSYGKQDIVGVSDFVYPDDEPDRGNPLAGFDKDDTNELFKLFGAMFADVLEWLYVPKNARLVGMRLKALLYCVRPDMLAGGTLQQIAHTEGVTKQTFQALTRSFRQRFGIICRSMRTDLSREHMRAAALRAHSTRRKKQ